MTLNDGTELAMTQDEFDELNRLHNYIVELMLVVDRLCRENGITYYLGEGSLLGAVRHKGFIPWDDDGDLLMPREDYDRFLELAPELLGDDYQLDCLQTNPKHWSIPSMLQITRETEFEKEMYRGVALNCGPCVDIFPLDYVPEQGTFALRLRSKLINLLKRSLWIKTGIHHRGRYQTIKKRLVYFYPCKLISLFGSVKSLHRSINRLLLKTNDSSNKYLANFASLYNIGRETFPKEWYGKPIELEFEGSKFYAPSNTEAVLTKLYGDYNELPPIEKRTAKHHFNNFGQ